MTPVSVCIAAYNEENTIDHVLEYCSSLPRDLMDETLVCANGCTDNTADNVRAWNRTDSRFRLIEEPKPSKPNAWNILVEQARNNTLVFFDADIKPEEKSLENLIVPLEDEEIIATSGVVDFDIPWHNWYTIFEPVYQDGVSGAVYAFKKQKMLEKMARWDYQKMPEVCAEDTWVWMLLEKDEFQKVQNAKVIVQPPNFQDQLRYIARGCVVQQEFQEAHEKIYANWLHEFRFDGDRWKLLRDKAKKIDSLSLLAYKTASTVIRKTILRLYRSALEEHIVNIKRAYGNNSGSAILNSVARAESTKRPF
tara:strand:- start:1224 stop:2147 length:924 start_codon:yes stop_codon:yes gene_type:complete